MRSVSNNLICSVLFAGLVILADRTGAAELNQSFEDLIAPYPRAQVLNSGTTGVRDYPLAAGATRKVSGRWAPEQSLRIAGELTRLTQRIPEGHDPREAFQYYRRRLERVDARTIYLCRQRNCGSSNAWANEVFEVKQLYGLDQHQYYGLFEVVDEQDQLNYLALYTVRRGNNRVFAHLELLETDQSSEAAVPPDPEAIAEQLREQGYYSIRGVQLKNGQLAFQSDYIRALAGALRRIPRLLVRIVGHDYGRRPLPKQMELSRDYARQLFDQLAEAGVSEGRLEIHGVGSLVPMRIGAGGKRDTTFRLELVLAD